MNSFCIRLKIDLTERTSARRAVYIIPLAVIQRAVFDATLWVAVSVHVTVRFSRVPVGVVERNHHVGIGLPHERRVAVVGDDALSAREQCRSGVGSVPAGRRRAYKKRGTSQCFYFR